MDKDELLKYLRPMLAEYTLYDVDIEHPLKETLRKKNNGRWKGDAHQYDIKRDKLVASAFKSIPGDNERQRGYYRMAAIVITSILCKFSLSSPTHQQLGDLVRLSAYDAESMNWFLDDLSSEELTYFGSHALTPVGALLFRTLWDYLCEDGKVLTTEQRKKRKEVRRKGESASYYRSTLLQVTEYLHTNNLLDFFSIRPYTVDEFACFIDASLSGEDVTLRRQEAVDAYETAIRKAAVMECKRCVLQGEMEEFTRAREDEQSRMDLEFYHRVDKRVKEHEKPFKSGKGGKPFTLASNDGIPDLKQFQLSGIHSNSGDILKSSQIPPYMTDIANEFDARVDQLSSFCKAVQDNAETELERMVEQEAQILKTDDFIEIGESAFLAISMGDPFYRTKIGHRLFLLMAHAVCIPAVKLLSPELEDEDEWDDWGYPGDNGKLESTVISDTDVAFYNPEEMHKLKIPLKIGAVLAGYAECPVELPLTFRKSYVKAYKSLGLSDRKARDLAIITSTLSAVHRHDEDDTQYYPDESPGPSDAAGPSAPIAIDDAVRAAQSERDEAVRLKKAAEKESQMLRHEIAKLRRTLENTEAELERSNTLLGLYESIRPEEEDNSAKEDESLFPYYTNLKVVLYGGFPSFSKDIQALFPNIRVMDSTAHLDVNLVRNADIVFIQLNHTSHSNYWNVRDTASASGVPYFHLNYAGPRRCAGVMVGEIRKFEIAKGVENR